MQKSQNTQTTKSTLSTQSTQDQAGEFNKTVAELLKVLKCLSKTPTDKNEIDKLNMKILHVKQNLGKDYMIKEAYGFFNTHYDAIIARDEEFFLTMSQKVTSEEFKPFIAVISKLYKTMTEEIRDELYNKILLMTEYTLEYNTQ